MFKDTDCVPFIMMKDVRSGENQTHIQMNRSEYVSFPLSNTPAVERLLLRNSRFCPCDWRHYSQDSRWLNFGLYILQTRRKWFLNESKNKRASRFSSLTSLFERSASAPDDALLGLIRPKGATWDGKWWSKSLQVFRRSLVSRKLSVAIMISGANRECIKSEKICSGGLSEPLNLWPVNIAHFYLRRTPFASEVRINLFDRAQQYREWNRNGLV